LHKVYHDSMVGRAGGDIPMSDKSREVPKCIFTDDCLDKTTKPEHVLHNAFGGRKTTKRVICSRCNNTFGSSIDRSLTEQFEVIRNLLKMPSGSGAPAPMLRNLHAGSQIVNAHGDGKLELVAKPFTVTKRADGAFDVQINARSLDEIDRLIPHIAASIGMPEPEVRRQLSQATATQVEHRPGTIPFNLVFGGEEALRSAAKSCLVLWALTVGNEEVGSSEYEEVRTFVLRGGEGFRQSRTQLDSRIPIEIERLTQGYGPVFNLIYIRSDEHGCVIGHFTLYNLVAFQFILAESGGTPNKKTGLISNPLEPRIWSNKAGESFDIPFEWLKNADYRIDLAGERFSQIMKTYVDISTPQEWERIMHEVFDRHGIGENDPIPPSVLPQIISEISNRIGRHVTGLPFERAITVEDMKRALGRSSPE
jgi:hypothetical protein